MNRAILTLPGCVGLIALVVAHPVTAQNLLTNNAGFEANTGYYTPGWGWPDGSPDALPGWVITLDPTGDGYAGAATNQLPQDLEGTHFGYIYSGTGSAGFLETTPDSRAPIEAGTTYTCWFLARGDSPSGEALATASLIWYVNQNNDTTSGDPATLDLILPIRLSTEDPMSTYHITAVAPNGAHYAGVRIARPGNNYDPIIVDDFVIMAEPTRVSVSLSKNSNRAVLAWPRGLGQHLEENSNPAVTSAWHKVNQPIRGIGATNVTDYPLTEDVRFFRVAVPKNSP
jgi:hypothetical protein